MAEPGDPGDVEFWRGRGVGAGDICAVFLGALTDQFDFEPLIAACKILSRTYPSLKWVVCGRGPLLDDLRRRAASVPAMIVPGWVDRQQMAALFAQSVVALAPYRVLPDFQMSIPNKVPEYLAGGLPIVTSLRNSEVSRLLEVNGCGSVYPEGNATELARQISAILVRAPVEKDAVRRSCLGLYEKEFRADMVYGRYADHIEAVAVGAGAPM
jgi:glycosyltransferase involved in cell wall biosynthesis